MGLVVADLMAKLGLDDSAFNRGLDQNMSAFSRHTGAAGAAMTRGLTMPILAAGAVSVKMAADFETSMTLIQTQAGGTAKDVKFLSDAVLGMKDVQHGPKELADSLYHLKSVGMDNKSAMDALTASEHLASVGGSDLQTTTNAIASAFKTGISGAQDFNLAAATINATIGAGNLRLEDYVSAMGTGVLVSAKQAGISLTDVGAAIATMTSRGIPATRAATSLKMAFSAMEAPTDKMSKVLGDIGLKQMDLATAMRTGGLPAAVNLLKDHLQGLSETAQTADLTKMFGAKSSQAILTLIANTEDYAKVQKQIVDNSTSGAFAKAIAAQGKDAGAVWHKALAELSSAAVKAGDVLLPAAANIAKGIGAIVGAFGKLGPAGTTAAVAFAGVLAAAGPVLTVMSKLSMLKMAKTVSGLGGAGGGGVLGGASDATLRAAIALNTTATEANTLALGGKGALPGGGGGKPVAAPLGAPASAAEKVGMGFIRTVAAIAVPIAVGATAGEIVYAHRPARTPLGEASASGLVNPRSGTIMTPERIALFRKNGEQAGDAVADGISTRGKDIARSLRASGDKAGAGLAAGLARGVGPALQSIQKVRNSAGKTIHMGHLDATQMLNEIARVSRALGGISSAARTASNAAANAIRSPSGGGGSYRGHFMAAGGYVPARPGGTTVTLGEGGEGETVTPDSKMGRGGDVHIHIANVNGTDRAAASKFADMVGGILMQQVRFA